MIFVRSDHSTNGAHTHPTRTAVDAVHLLMLLAPPLWHVVHGRHERMAFKHGWLQVNLEVLGTHRGTAHQAGLHSHLLLMPRAVVADYRNASWRPYTGFIWKFLSLLKLVVGWWLLNSTTECPTKISLSLTTLRTWFSSWSYGYMRCSFLWINVLLRRLSFHLRCFWGCFLFCWCLTRVIGGVILRWIWAYSVSIAVLLKGKWAELPFPEQIFRWVVLRKALSKTLAC